MKEIFKKFDMLLNGFLTYSQFKYFNTKYNIEKYIGINKNILNLKQNLPKANYEFKKKIKELQIEVRYNTAVKDLIVKDDSIQGVAIESNGKTETLNVDNVILATGGKSYPLTGSTGDGYKMAEKTIDKSH